MDYNKIDIEKYINNFDGLDRKKIKEEYFDMALQQLKANINYYQMESLLRTNLEMIEFLKSERLACIEDISKRNKKGFGYLADSFSYIDFLTSCYHLEFFNIELHRLQSDINSSTPKQENHILEIIHNHLNGLCFNATYEQFERLIIDTGIPLKKIVWLKQLAELKALFDWLLARHILNSFGIPDPGYINKWLEERFYFKKEGKPAKSDNLASSTSKENYKLIMDRSECKDSFQNCEHLFTPLFKSLVEIKKNKPVQTSKQTNTNH